jgi:photosystem II stability/assembly factor-like uncharacterized protein
MRRISVLITTVALALSGLALTAPGVSATANWISVSAGNDPPFDSQNMEASDDGKYVLVSGWTDLWVSIDGGTNWTSRKRDNAVTTPGGWSSVAVSKTGSVMFADKSYGAEMKGLWKSTDYGTTWAKVPGLSNATYGTSISDDASVIFTHDLVTGGLMSSLNAGATWNPVIGVVNAYPVVSPDGSTIVAYSNDQLYISRDMGLNWSLIRATSSDAPVSHPISSVALSRNGSTIAFTENGALAESAMFVSTNYGVTWRETVLPESNYYNAGYTVMSDDGKKIVTSTQSSAYTNPKLFRSVDSGLTWTETLSIPGDIAIQGIHSSPTGESVKMYAQNTAIYSGFFPDAKRALAITKPYISGTAKSTKKGANKLVAKSRWSGYPNPAVTYQWYSCTTKVANATTAIPSNCKPISKATKSTLALTKKFKGKFVAVAVTGKSTGTPATKWLSKTTAKVK